MTRQTILRGALVVLLLPVVLTLSLSVGMMAIDGLDVARWLGEGGVAMYVPLFGLPLARAAAGAGAAVCSRGGGGLQPIPLPPGSGRTC